MQNQNSQFDFLDLITLISFVIAIQNLKENEQQSKILEEKLDNQDNQYLQKIIEQNKLIIEQNEKLLERS